jgi:hypothetical protein
MDQSLQFERDRLLYLREGLQYRTGLGQWVNSQLIQPDVILSAATAGREPALSEVEGNLTTADAIDGVNGMPVLPAVLAPLASV